MPRGQRARRAAPTRRPAPKPTPSQESTRPFQKSTRGTRPSQKSTRPSQQSTRPIQSYFQQTTRPDFPRGRHPLPPRQHVESVREPLYISSDDSFDLEDLEDEDEDDMDITVHYRLNREGANAPPKKRGRPSDHDQERDQASQPKRARTERADVNYSETSSRIPHRRYSDVTEEGEIENDSDVGARVDNPPTVPLRAKTLARFEPPGLFDNTSPLGLLPKSGPAPGVDPSPTVVGPYFTRITFKADEVLRLDGDDDEDEDDELPGSNQHTYTKAISHTVPILPGHSKDYVFDFGRYIGSRFDEVPEQYLDQIQESVLNGDMDDKAGLEEAFHWHRWSRNGIHEDSDDASSDVTGSEGSSIVRRLARRNGAHEGQSAGRGRARSRSNSGASRSRGKGRGGGSANRGSLRGWGRGHPHTSSTERRRGSANSPGRGNASGGTSRGRGRGANPNTSRGRGANTNASRGRGTSKDRGRPPPRARARGRGRGRG